MKNLVIVGGGSAGWISALYFNTIRKDLNITIIESSEIGILGAGEGTVPNFSKFLQLIKINEKDFFEKTKSSKKVSVDFINWKGDGDRYQNPFFGTTMDKPYGWHFDARLIAEYFKSIAISRGVNLIDDVVDGFIKNGDDIISIKTKKGININSDFVIDCTGFKRLIIGKEYKSEWNSYSSYLKTNSAVVFLKPQNEHISFNTHTRTSCTALKYGWLFEIPLQHRIGNGYIYDSNYISEEEAKNEVIEYLGYRPNFVNSFKFEAGCFKESWKGNCVAIGLASGFLEPLEATSIMTSIMQLERLNDTNFDKSQQKYYNDLIFSINEQNMLFVKYHYMCDRMDSPFWVDNSKTEIPEKLLNLLDTNFDVKIKSRDELYEAVSGISQTSIPFALQHYLLINKGNRSKYKKGII
jgi:tryptophan halogenase